MQNSRQNGGGWGWSCMLLAYNKILIILDDLLGGDYKFAFSKGGSRRKT